MSAVHSSPLFFHHCCDLVVKSNNLRHFDTFVVTAPKIYSNPHHQPRAPPSVLVSTVATPRDAPQPIWKNLSCARQNAQKRC